MFNILIQQLTTLLALGCFYIAGVATTEQNYISAALFVGLGLWVLAHRIVWAIVELTDEVRDSKKEGAK